MTVIFRFLAGASLLWKEYFCWPLPGLLARLAFAQPEICSVYFLARQTSPRFAGYIALSFHFYKFLVEAV